MSAISVTKFKHVSYLWDEKKAAELKGDEVGLLIYRSNLLGADLRLDARLAGGVGGCDSAAVVPGGPDHAVPVLPGQAAGG